MDDPVSVQKEEANVGTGLSAYEQQYKNNASLPPSTIYTFIAQSSGPFYNAETSDLSDIFELSNMPLTNNEFNAKGVNGTLGDVDSLFAFITPREWVKEGQVDTALVKAAVATTVQKNPIVLPNQSTFQPSSGEDVADAFHLQLFQEMKQSFDFNALGVVDMVLAGVYHPVLMDLLKRKLAEDRQMVLQASISKENFEVISANEIKSTVVIQIQTTEVCGEITAETTFRSGLVSSYSLASIAILLSSWNECAAKPLDTPPSQQRSTSSSGLESLAATTEPSTDTNVEPTSDTNVVPTGDSNAEDANMESQSEPKSAETEGGEENQETVRKYNQESQNGQLPWVHVYEVVQNEWNKATDPNKEFTVEAMFDFPVFDQKTKSEIVIDEREIRGTLSLEELCAYISEPSWLGKGCSEKKDCKFNTQQFKMQVGKDTRRMDIRVNNQPFQGDPKGEKQMPVVADEFNHMLMEAIETVKGTIDLNQIACADFVSVQMYQNAIVAFGVGIAQSIGDVEFVPVSDLNNVDIDITYDDFTVTVFTSFNLFPRNFDDFDVDRPNEAPQCGKYETVTIFDMKKNSYQLDTFRIELNVHECELHVEGKGHGEEGYGEEGEYAEQGDGEAGDALGAQQKKKTKDYANDLFAYMDRNKVPISTAVVGTAAAAGAIALLSGGGKKRSCRKRRKSSKRRTRRARSGH